MHPFMWIVRVISMLLQNYVSMALIKLEGFSQQHMVNIYIYSTCYVKENKSGERHKHVHFKSMGTGLVWVAF